MLQFSLPVNSTPVMLELLYMPSPKHNMTAARMRERPAGRWFGTIINERPSSSSSRFGTVRDIFAQTLSPRRRMRVLHTVTSQVEHVIKKNAQTFYSSHSYACMHGRLWSSPSGGQRMIRCAHLKWKESGWLVTWPSSRKLSPVTER